MFVEQIEVLEYRQKFEVEVLTSICCCQKRKQNTAHSAYRHHTERDKQDCRDVMGARQTSGPSACGRVSSLKKTIMSI